MVSMLNIAEYFHSRTKRVGNSARLLGTSTCTETVFRNQGIIGIQIAKGHNYGVGISCRKPQMN